jgi:hypothetical protein
LWSRPVGLGEARRHMKRRTALLMMSTQQKQQIQKQTGKDPEKMSEAELNSAMDKTGIEPIGDVTDKQINELENLSDLKERGVLTAQEFEYRKIQILNMPAT